MVENEFDIDFDIEIPSHEVYFFDPHHSGVHTELCAHGINTSASANFSEIMNAAQAGIVAGVVVAPGTDTELRELFMAAFRGRFADIPVAYLVPTIQLRDVMASAKDEGANQVFGYPFCPADCEKIVALFDLPRQPTAGETRVLQRKAEAVAVPRAVDEVTQLRSELTLVRERSLLMQKRVERLTEDLSNAVRERDFLARTLRDDRRLRPVSDVDARTDRIRKLGDSAESFVWGIEQTIRFLEEVQFEGGRSTPVVARHLKTLGLTRAMFLQLKKTAEGL